MLSTTSAMRIAAVLLILMGGAIALLLISERDPDPLDPYAAWDDDELGDAR